MNKKASVLIYAIVLTTIALMLSSVLLANKTSLLDTQKYYKINSQLFNQIKSNNKNNYDNLIKTNSDWNGFVDNYEWTWTNIYCRLQADWSYFIEWDSGSILWSDGYDDNCNSDNYLWNNTGSTDYMSGFEDNDNMARKELIWIIVPGQQKNIFWNNKKIEEFIENNPNNHDNFNKTLSGVVDWNLFLNLSTGALLTLVEYNKKRYDDFKEIREIKSYTWSVTGSWYIEKNWNILSLNSSVWANTFSFNFTNSGYLLFLTNTGSDLISYSLSGKQNSTGSWIYLNPINDDISNTWSIEILGYDVMINSKWNIFWKMIEKVFEK